MVPAVFFVAVPEVHLVGFGLDGDQHHFFELFLLDEEGDEDDVVLIEFGEEGCGVDLVDVFFDELVDGVGVEVEDAVRFLSCAAFAV